MFRAAAASRSYNEEYWVCRYAVSILDCERVVAMNVTITISTWLCMCVVAPAIAWLDKLSIRAVTPSPPFWTLAFVANGFLSLDSHDLPCSFICCCAGALNPFRDSKAYSDDPDSAPVAGFEQLVSSHMVHAIFSPLFYDQQR